MKKLLIPFTVFLFLSAFAQTDSYRTIKNESFKKGEHIEYLVHYGLINAGTATVDVDEKFYLLNNRYCYKIDVVGKTSGAAGILAKVNDNWRTYLDTTSFIPHRSFRNIEEGVYRRQELTDFNPLTNTATMKFEEGDPKDANRKKGKKTFQVPQYVQDIVSGYYFLRTIDFDKLKENEIISVPGMLEDQLYNLNIRYKGKETIRTKFGKMNVHKLIPIMPENQMFSGESSIRFWVSDDKNRIPIKIEADM